MNKQEILNKLDTIENLPTLPIVAQKTLQLVSNKDSTMGQIAEVVNRDQAIAARVIRLTNSAFYGFSNRISSINHAIVILGLNTVKNLVLGISVVKTFAGCCLPSGFNREQFWIHTFSTAQGAKSIAEYLQLPNEEDYFIAGLLHDIGILAIDQFFHDQFIKILEYSAKHNVSYLECELDMLGITHGELGGKIVERWKVPDFIIDTLTYHHNPSEFSMNSEESRTIVPIVHIADTKSQKEGIGTFINNFSNSYDEAILKEIKLTEGRLDKIFVQVKKETNTLIREWGL
jgi:putative nucleotidyltransferase with HDIG domain